MARHGRGTITACVWILGAWSGIGLPANAQWNPALRQELLAKADPGVVSVEQVRIYADLSGSWQLSAKALPYLDHLDTLLQALEATGPGTDAAFLRNMRAQAHYRRGYQAKFRRDVPHALAYFRAAQRLQPGGSSIRIREAVATLFRAVNEPDLAIAEMREALAATDTTAGEAAHRQSIAAALITLGGAYADLGDAAQAEHWFAKAAADTLVAGVNVMLLDERAKMLARQGDTLGAIALHQRVLAICTPPPDHWDMIAPLSAIARLQLARKDHRSALAMADSCARVARQTGDEAAWCCCSVLAGQAELALGREVPAERRLRMALDTAQHYGYIGLSRATGDDGSMVRAAELLKELFLRQGRWAEAVRMTTWWSTLKDSLNAKDGRLEVLRAELGRAALADSLALAGRAAETLAGHQQQLAKEKARRTYLISVAVATVLILALVALLLVRRAQHARRLAEQEGLLRAKQVDDLLQQQEIKAMGALLEGQEKERERLAQELHGRVGSMLGNVKMQMEVLKDRIGTDHQEHAAQCGKVYDLLTETVGEVRRISHDLGTVVLARFGLAKALENLCASVHAHGRLEVELHTHGLEYRMGHAREIAVYRIVQELIGNVLKHAEAREISVSVTRGRDHLCILVYDDGKGFNPQEALNGQGMGLEHVRSQATSIGCDLLIDSTPGRGATVRIEGPMAE